MNKLRLLFIIAILASCTDSNQSFYEDDSDGDLYVMPLLPPYKLTQLYGTDENTFSSNSWTLHYQYGGDTTVNKWPQVQLKEINVVNGIIYGHNPPYNNAPDLYIVII